MYLRPPRKGRLARLGPALKAMGLAEISFTKSPHGHCIVDVEVNGARGKMVIDTGATFTALDGRFASQVQIKGREAALLMVDAAGALGIPRVGRMTSLRVGGVPIRAPDLAIGAFGFYSESGGQLIGVLGMDVLGQNWGIIDFGNRKLYLAEAR
jgi:hypothetical protein